MENKIENNKEKVSYKSLIAVGLSLLAGSYYFFTKKSKSKLDVVENVDLERYAGKWYEIAYIPYIWEKSCSNTTAEYTVKDGYVEVINSCTKNILSEETECVQGKAYPVSGTNNAKLKVQFFWPLKGDYWVIDLDKNYKYAMVGSPDMKHLWILSRKPELDEPIYQKLIQKAKDKGFDITKLKRTEHYKSLKKQYASIK